MPEFNPDIHGHLRQPNNRGKARLENFTGQRFNRLLVYGFLGMADTANGRVAQWLCRCDCGKWWVTIPTRLKNGESQSCGCWNLDKISPAKTHGKSKTLVHRIWTGIKTRIFNPNHKSSKRYGRSGITMCKGFEGFEWFYSIVGEPPTDVHSIDRYPLKKGGYWCGECADCIENGMPKNWRWATPLEQGSNMETNVMLTYNDETHHLSEWARLLKINISVLSKRVRDGWPAAQALGYEIHPSRRNVYLTANGKTMRIIDWANELGIPRSKIANRRRLGWTDEQCLGILERVKEREGS